MPWGTVLQALVARQQLVDDAPGDPEEVHRVTFQGVGLMLKVDCGGISESLTESELFGYNQIGRAHV